MNQVILPWEIFHFAPSCTTESIRPHQTHPRYLFPCENKTKKTKPDTQRNQTVLTGSIIAGSPFCPFSPRGPPICSTQGKHKAKKKVKKGITCISITTPSRERGPGTTCNQRTPDVCVEKKRGSPCSSRATHAPHSG